MTINYEITVVSTSTQVTLFQMQGERYENNLPVSMMDQVGKRYANCTVIFHNLTEGWRAEKDYQ